MRSQSLFHSQRMQDIGLAVVMAAVLLASVGAAYALTAARPASTSHSLQLIRRTFDDLHIYLPKNWTRLPVAELPAALAKQAMRYADPDRPARRITLVRLALTHRVASGRVLGAITPKLLGAQTASQFKLATTRVFQRPGLRVTEWVGATPSANGKSLQLHLIADLTANRRVHWLVYLTDTAQPHEDPQGMLHLDLGLLRGLCQSATIGRRETRDGSQKAEDGGRKSDVRSQGTTRGGQAATKKNLGADKRQ